MPLENIVRRLDKVKKVGKEYQACCPVHGDKNPSMRLREEAGKVLAHCFACGANGYDVVQALEMSPNELFADKMGSEEAKRRRLESYELEDKLIISIFESDKEKGHLHNITEYRRYKLAKYRQQLLIDKGYRND